MKLLKRIPKTVFTRIPKTAGAHDFFTTYSHRASATIYGLYIIWGILTAFGNIPTIANTTNDFTQFVFSICVSIVCIPAFIGSLWFPKTARLELYGGLGFISLMSLYLLIIGSGLFSGDITKIASIILIGSILVMPIKRCAFILTQLLRQQKKLEETNEQPIIGGTNS